MSDSKMEEDFEEVGKYIYRQRRRFALLEGKDISQNIQNEKEE